MFPKFRWTLMALLLLVNCLSWAQSETKVFKTPLGNLTKYQFTVTGNPPDANKTQASQQRMFFLLKNPEGNLEVIWQDIQNQKIFVSKFNANLTSIQTIPLPNMANTILLAATNDAVGNYYYITYQTFSNDDTNDLIFLSKASSNGTLLKKQVQKSDQANLDIFHISSYGGTLQYQNGYLLFMMGRIMNQSSDGLNHQGGIAVAFDPTTLSVIRNFGQTSGHSFDNFLTQSQDGNFVAIDLGDNYPRGIHLHKFGKEYINSKVIYTFKTEHGTEAGGYDGSKTYPLYAEISSPAQKYYKWSNDNQTYTELGGIVETNDGYCVVFAGEPDPNGKSLNSSRIGEANKDPRNIGFIKIRKDFETVKAPSWNVVPKEIILSKGISEKGGFYTFGGEWTPQANEGVTWLTRYTNAKTENAKFMKTASLPDGNILILFGKGSKSSWDNSNSGYSPYMLTLQSNGSINLPEYSLPADLKLNRRDEILVINNQVLIVQGNAASHSLELFALDLSGQTSTETSAPEITLEGDFNSLQGVMHPFSCYCGNGGRLTLSDGTKKFICFPDRIPAPDCQRIKVTGKYVRRAVSAQPSNPCPEGERKFFEVKSYLCQ
ncbi:hypothetical protein QNI16_37870 [Cytophagaceae bacterium YF14B1]|uniref:Uncharacterized protein n=1 Tax=Xanthocytophaga flava TaxID=3048013 RepID=A0AAE3R033_9BACT|nr:hypothetical protein [Xanthocytophaga flavus]MDJ1486310.1 hypothetical protein [Xanthocytophaga flavus]